MILRLFVVCLLLSILGCEDDQTSNVPKTPTQKVRAEKAKPIEEPIVEVETKDAFVYISVGKRDPFESLLKQEAESQNTNVPKTPLEKFDLSQFRIQAILVGKGAPRAMASAPDGKNYILKPGLKIGKNNGVITDINRTEIVVEEPTIDIAGNPVKGFHSLTIPKK